MQTTNNNNTDPEIKPAPLFSIFIGKLVGFLDFRGFSNQLERQVKKRQNVGFVNPSFELMMKSVGWTTSQAWCGYYVKLVLMELFSFDKEWLSKNLGGGAVQNFENIKNLNKKGDKRYIAFTSGKLQVGDVFCQGIVGNGHTGIIVQILDEKTNFCETIEGNTNSSKSREGDKVKKLQRYLTVGKPSGGKIVKGFYRRNFTEDELKSLRFDDEKQTFVFDNIS
jgi:hypothetical protein